MGHNFQSRLVERLYDLVQMHEAKLAADGNSPAQVFAEVVDVLLGRMTTGAVEGRYPMREVMRLRRTIRQYTDHIEEEYD